MITIMNDVHIDNIDRNVPITGGAKQSDDVSPYATIQIGESGRTAVVLFFTEENTLVKLAEAAIKAKTELEGLRNG